ncbi:flagellar protein G [Methanofervidicoccus abyssi]|uniref:Archaeal flagellar protein FlaG n=1 Tax=Methanofervidicoccus abyssi TaxID=2082189 RepID=A0A401HPH1_9EURY|nr:flagellar protein G [Methanofervidicoccus abyssi]GBF36085.1 archaeal flagellar protein FlaG [Methanofervidicoccus abyssi]
MASNIFSEMILFVSVLIIAAAVTGILVTTTHEISLGINDKGDLLSSRLSQDFEIINDPENVPRDVSTGTILIYIKNTGKSPITFNKDVLTVMIDGDVVPIISTEVIGNETLEVLYPSMVGSINVSYNNTGYHVIKVITDSGIIRSLKVYIQ